ncbi:hypothetical protein ACFO26_08905 [Lactococcus nasutitermitis]|uniref:FeoB-associated Cys-rich membrane protein n=1 Tax=Lactococcus nasutitermitis TaxID=1652957 RepID=A0ABV9JFF2_9LACT|nr:hypothetical protein [Lactococcus nasutitermitis]
MNLASIILFLLILIAITFALRKVIKSKGACDDCKASCPIKSTTLQASPKNHDCCK